MNSSCQKNEEEKERSDKRKKERKQIFKNLIYHVWLYVRTVPVPVYVCIYVVHV